MSMSFAQYCRIETLAGGLRGTPREFVRACHTVLSAEGRSHAMRDIRHAWIRDGLAYRLEQRGHRLNRLLFATTARGAE